ncbi:MAG: aminopeptidase, partial [Bacteroidota bacterium]
SGNRVVSYNKNEEGNYERYVQNFDGHGDGGMISTINDLYLWDQNFYHKRVGGQALQDIILSRQRLANGFLHAYSFGIEHGQYKGLKINMHGGNFLGFNHHFTRFSDNNFSVIVLANTSEVDPYFITDRISDLFLSDLYKNPEPSSKEEPSEPAAEYIISPEELSRYEGTYWNYDDNYSRKIYVLDDTLRYQRGPNNVSAFLPIAQDKFEMLGNSNVKLTFGIGDNTPNHLSVSVGESRFFNFTKYEPADYSLQELESFVGLYVSPELDCHYEIRRQEEQLVLFIKEKEISPLLPVMKDYFTNDMLGSISFNKMNRDEFVLKSGRVRGIIFTKKP